MTLILTTRMANPPSVSLKGPYRSYPTEEKVYANLWMTPPSPLSSDGLFLAWILTARMANPPSLSLEGPYRFYPTREKVYANLWIDSTEPTLTSWLVTTYCSQALEWMKSNTIITPALNELTCGDEPLFEMKFSCSLALCAIGSLPAQGSLYQIYRERSISCDLRVVWIHVLVPPWVTLCAQYSKTKTNYHRVASTDPMIYHTPVGVT
jgi:hypothetical protein